MKINETFIRTSKNYGLNEFEVPDDMFDNGLITDKASKNNLPTSPLCEKALVQLEKCGQDIKINLDEKQNNATLLLNEDFICKKIKITAKEGVDAKVIIRFENDKKVLNNSFIKLVCEKESKLNIIILADFEKTSKHFLTFENELQENSTLNVIYTDFSCDYSVLRYIANLYGDNAQAYFKNIYLGKNEDKIDINIAKNIYGKNCKTDIQTIGALFDKELALTFPKQTKSKALPLLLSHEEDVKGSHSSATGKFDNQTLFYVMSRGLDRKQAVMLLLKAKMEAIIKEIFDENLKKEISDKIERRINYEG